jgi:hypothetical protein
MEGRQMKKLIFVFLIFLVTDSIWAGESVSVPWKEFKTLYNVHLAFLISALTSVTLVTSYLAAALGKKFPWKIAAAGQLFFLVLFSYSFFIKGITGLTVAIGSVVTLAILMRATASVDWNKIFVKPMKITKTDRHPGLKSD